MRAIRSEWLKLVSVRTTWLLLGSMVLIEAAYSIASTSGNLKDLRSGNVENLLIGSPLVTVFVFSIGALLSTNEFRHKTADTTFVVTPRRERVVLAKFVVGLLAGLVSALLFIAVNAGFGLSILSQRGVPVDSDKAVNVYVGVGVAIILISLLGVGLGALIRTQVVTIVLGIALFLLLRDILTSIIGQTVGAYLPGPSLLALQGTADKAWLVSQVGGGLILTAYCVAVGVAAVIATREREIT